MKNRTIVFLLLLMLALLTSKYAYPSKTYSISAKYTTNTKLVIDAENVIYGVRLTGNVNLNSENSLVRILFHGTNGEIILLNEYYYPLYLPGRIEIGEVEENILINGILISKIEIIVIDASLWLENFTVYNSETERNQNIKSTYNQIMSEKIDSLNANLEHEGFIWRAEKPNSPTFFSHKDFGGDYSLNTHGFEYYGFGIFSDFGPSHYVNRTTQRSMDNSIVNEWDWRNRHGATNETSPYYDYETEQVWDNVTQTNQYINMYNGWMTKIHSQNEWSGCPYGCFLFAPLNAVEAMLNLYYNQHINLYLSQQYAMDCCPDNYKDCFTGGYVSLILEATKNTGIIEDSCYPYLNAIGNCQLLSVPQHRVFINSYQTYNNVTLYSDNDIKTKIIQYGPMAADVNGHSMCLVGYNIIHEGLILNGHSSYYNIVVPDNSGYIGLNYFIYKNSRSAADDHNGYVYAIRTYFENPEVGGNGLTTLYSINTPQDNLSPLTVRCVDLDEDGYYNWGIGPKPANCPNCPDEPDCDDSKAYLGPYDSRYGCTLLCDNFNYDTSKIIINDKTVWSDRTIVNQDIIINEDSLFVYDELLLHDLSTIRIKNGASLILAKNSVLKGACSDSLFAGSIIVESGGNLILKDSSNIYFNCSGGINVQGNATLYYGKSCNIYLGSSSSALEIAGNLHIGDNATFTTSGNGYVKFSNTGTWDNTYNVTSGINSAVVFKGTGQNDKKLEIEQSTVRFPQLDSLSFRNCKIEMGSEKRMQADYNYPITFSNVLLTSKTGANNDHRSFNFYGQANVTIDNCTFEYGRYGIYGILTYFNNSMTVTNSTFRYNKKGMQIYDKGLHLSGCTFLNNSEHGVYCDAMKWTSSFDDCVFSNNGTGNYYMGNSTANVAIDDCSFSNSTNGFAFSGSFDVDIECSSATDNMNGIYTQNGTRIIPSMCSLAGNAITINLDYGYISLLNGYNELQAFLNYYTVYGRTPAVGTILAHNNRWESNASAHPSYMNNYYLRKNIKPYTQVDIYDYTPSYLACIALLEPNRNQLPSDAEYDALMSYNMENEQINNPGDIVNRCVNYITSKNNSREYLDTYCRDNVYGYLYSLLSRIFSTGETDIDQRNRILDNVIQMNEYLSENAEANVHSYKYLLDAALLFRTADKLEIASQRINDLIQYVNEQDFDSDEYLEFVMQWKCYIENEMLLKSGELNPDEFFEYIQGCGLQYSAKSTWENASSFQKNCIENISQVFELNLSPNPTDNTIKIELPEEISSQYQISIMSESGNIVRNFVSNANTTEIDVSELDSGIYFVKAFASGKFYIGKFSKY
jgi:hypothetical protein